MGWVLFIGFIALVIYLAWKGAQDQAANNAKLGGGTGAIHRVTGVNYLGGYPAAPEPVSSANLIISSSEVAIEKGANLVARIPMGTVVRMLVETEEEAKQRLTATRLLGLGIFALAFPKKTAGSVMITIETDAGPVLLEKAKTTKPVLLRTMSPAIICLNTNARGVTAPRAPAVVAPSARELAAPRPSVGDELTKLARLRDDGVLDEVEFAVQKARLLEG